MSRLLRFRFALTIVLLALGAACMIRAGSIAAPTPVTTPQPGILDVTTADLPKVVPVAVEIRKGQLASGGATIWHTHPSPIFVYVERGTGAWEYRDGRPAETRVAGQAIEEPAKVVTRIVNSGTSRLDLVVFQVSKPGDPVLLPAKP